MIISNGHRYDASALGDMGSVWGTIKSIAKKAAPVVAAPVMYPSLLVLRGARGAAGKLAPGQQPPGALGPAGYDPGADTGAPKWLLPVGLGAGALLVIGLLRRRSA